MLKMCFTLLLLFLCILSCSCAADQCIRYEFHENALAQEGNADMLINDCRSKNSKVTDFNSVLLSIYGPAMINVTFNCCSSLPCKHDLQCPFNFNCQRGRCLVADCALRDEIEIVEEENTSCLIDDDCFFKIPGDRKHWRCLTPSTPCINGTSCEGKCKRCPASFHIFNDPVNNSLDYSLYNGVTSLRGNKPNDTLDDFVQPFSPTDFIASLNLNSLDIFPTTSESPNNLTSTTIRDSVTLNATLSPITVNTITTTTTTTTTTPAPTTTSRSISTTLRATNFDTTNRIADDSLTDSLSNVVAEDSNIYNRLANRTSPNRINNRHFTLATFRSTTNLPIVRETTTVVPTTLRPTTIRLTTLRSTTTRSIPTQPTTSRLNTGRHYSVNRATSIYPTSTSAPNIILSETTTLRPQPLVSRTNFIYSDSTTTMVPTITSRALATSRPLTTRETTEAPVITTTISTNSFSRNVPTVSSRTVVTTALPPIAPRRIPSLAVAHLAAISRLNLNTAMFNASENVSPLSNVNRPASRAARVATAVRLNSRSRARSMVSTYVSDLPNINPMLPATHYANEPLNAQPTRLLASTLYPVNRRSGPIAPIRRRVHNRT